jgi:hypothetical protein
MVSLSGVSGEPRWLWSDMLGGCSCLFCVIYIVLIVVVCVVINPSSILIQNVLGTLLKKRPNDNIGISKIVFSIKPEKFHCNGRT